MLTQQIAMASACRSTRSLIFQIGRQTLAQNASLRRSIPAFTIKRDDSIFTKYREPPNGFLFNEKPRKPGEKREWEDWEAIWYVGWGVSAVIAVLGVIYKPEPEYMAEARKEAQRRVAEIDAREALLSVNNDESEE